MNKLYIGIDLGGTFIKGGVVNGKGDILVQDKVPTQKDLGENTVVKNIVALCESLIAKSGKSKADFVGIGIGSPGMIDSKKGEVVYSCNLGWNNFNLCDAISSMVGLSARVANDANVAALGETKFGAGKRYNNTVMLTLGTGVGGGVVIDGKLFEGNKSAGTEMGHSVIVANGEPCSCGRRGCLEAYCSATALIRDTKRAMEKNPRSKMWEIGSLDEVTGKTAFDYKDSDETAKTVVENYLNMLGLVITNISNVFRPEAIILGGGVCAQGDNLILPLKAYLAREIYAGDKGPQVEILTASLGNSAGLLGAAALWLD